MDTGIEDLRSRPQHAQDEQNTHKRREMGDRLEDRYEDETANTQEEYNLTLTRRKTVCLLNHDCILLYLKVALQREREDIGRNNHRHHRGDEYLHDNTCCCNHTLVPQHDGSNITYRREGTTRISGNHNQCSIDETILLVSDKFTQNHNHHNRSRQVIEDSRQDECHEGNTPKQGPFRLRLKGVTHKIETTILIHQFNNGHGTHQEEEGRGGRTEMMFDGLRYGRSFHFADSCSNITAWINHEERPSGNEHKQCDSCLVDFRHTLDGYTEIANTENDDNRNR